MSRDSSPRSKSSVVAGGPGAGKPPEPGGARWCALSRRELAAGADALANGQGGLAGSNAISRSGMGAHLAARKQRFDSSRKSHVYGAVGSNDFGQQRQPSSAVPAPCVEGCGKNVAVISSGLTLITLVRTPLGLNVEANFASPAGDAVARAERQSPRACAQYPLRSVSAALSIRVSSDRWGRRSPRG